MFFDSSNSLVDSFFQKKFKYTKSPEWLLPSCSDLFQDDGVSEQIESLDNLKLHLNSVKSKLNDYPIESWSGHTRRRNPAGEITWKIKNQIKAEFVTQAWCKFYECIHQFSLVSSPELNSLHLCEAPGAFVAALNHYMHSTYSNEEINWKWLATSLNPYHESNPLDNMVTDDRFILHTFNQWVFGEDFTGNITHVKNIDNLAVEAQKLGRIDLITADGSIDCMETPDTQEETVSFLHFAEITTALSILSENGCFVIKMFTFFDIATISMIYLLNCVFREVYVFKPATSKCGNSEVYIICLGFDKKSKNLEECLRIMSAQLNGKNTIIPSLFKKSFFPVNFLIEHEICARMFMNYQINVIESNIYHYENPSTYDVKQCKTLRQQVSIAYMNKYKIKFIPEEKSILFKKHAQIQYEYHSREHHGSYTERCYLNKLSSGEKFKVLKKRFEDIYRSIQTNELEILKKLEKPKSFIILTYYHGKPVEKLHSSLFLNKHFIYLKIKIETIFPNLCNNSPKILDPCVELVSTTHSDNKLKILHFDASLLSTEYGLKEKILFKEILKILTTNKSIHKIIFKDYAFLTHFSISCLKVFWINYFNEISINYDNCTIELNDRQQLNVNEDYKINSNEFKNSIFCIVNIKELHQNDYSQMITNFNNKVFIKFFHKIFYNV